ncbi:methyl-accepting chemotaxis protein [Pseudodesulfovibrio aespoeensis]|uniref:methyl-accepting chemotaxis protein n=1 Tax=Pseudodesulfovibrio aespoeensis TaxID=182210 RepID=UPI002352420E|nr:methyl-accepting chemotaxis protein [Pseudodesulfovibrio aespoeensis]MCG2732868.1 Cache 3/Cache 2 fusion domain-containing protein [Pseudodesulfovibrio aespoeensis]
MTRLGFRSKLFIVSISIVVITIVCMSIVNFWQSRRAYLDNGLSTLESVSATLHETVMLQDDLARKKIGSDLNVLKAMMGVSGLPMFEVLYDVDMTVRDQHTGQTRDMVLPAFKLGSHYLHESTHLTDSVLKTAGVASSILQLHDGMLIRVSTTIAGPDGRPVRGLAMPADSEATRTVLTGERYEGMSRIDGRSYVTAYDPIRDFDSKVIGALEVAHPVIPDELAQYIGKVTVGGKGFSYVFRPDGAFDVAPLDPDLAQSVVAATLGKNGSDPTTGLLETGNGAVHSRVVRIEPWDAYLATSVTNAELLDGVDARIIRGALASGAIPLILAIGIIWLMSRQLMAPMNRLAAVADEVRRGNFECDFDYRANDAIGSTVTSFRHMVQEMKTQLGFSRGVLAGVTIPCAVVDLDNRLTHFNQAAVSMLGKRKTPDKYLGLLLNEVVYHDPSRRTLTQVVMEKRSQSEWEIDLTRDNDNATVTLHVVATPIYDLDNELIGAITIWVDLTEERTQKRAVEAKNALIEQAARDANEIARNVSAATRSLAERIDAASDGARKQRDRAEEASTAMEQMNKTVIEVAANASNTARMAEETRELARSGEDVVGRSVAMIRDVHEQSAGLRSQMAELGEHARGIGAIMGVITDIADQTNLLALNAAIEAARAGEAGRGFAVVADEVRKLAEKTMNATHEVGESIKSIQKSAKNSIESTDTANQALEACRELVERSGTSLQAIVGKVEESVAQVRNIATAAEQQAATSEQINRATDTVNTIAGETAEAMQESAAAIQALNTLSEDLRTAIDRMQN